MDHTETPPVPPTPRGAGRPPRRVSPMLAGALGAAGLAIAVVGLGVVGAGAEDTPALTGDAVPVGDAQIIGTLLPPGDLEDLDRLDPEEWDEIDAAFEAFETCLDERLGGVDVESDEAAVDEAFEAAEAACEDLLPEEVKADIAAFEAFESCLDEAEAGFEDLDRGIVWLDTADGGQAIQFSDTPGRVTIVGDAGGIEIESSDGVTILDDTALDELFEAQDAAFEACEDLLPDDAFVDEHPLEDATAEDED